MYVAFFSPTIPSWFWWRIKHILSTGRQISVFPLKDTLPTNYRFLRENKRSRMRSVLSRTIKNLSICVIICWIAQLLLFRKSLKPLIGESKTGYFIVLRVVRESETCLKSWKSVRKNRKTCLRCGILITLLITAWQCCMIGDIFDPFGGNKMEGEERLSCIGR